MDLFLRNPAMMTREPKKVKCPNCMSEHAYCPAPPATGGSQSRLQDRYSHNARAIFCSGSCPICLEDQIEPPMVAFACGHLVCVDDFKRLGGRVGADAMKTVVEVLEEEREEARREFQEGGGVEGIDMESLQRLAMFSGISGLGSAGMGGIPPFVQAASEIFGPEMAMSMFAGTGGPPGSGFFPQMGGDDDEDDDEDYDEDYDPDYDDDDDDYDEDEDDSDNDDLPALLNRDGTTAENDSDWDSDDDMPALQPPSRSATQPAAIIATASTVPTATAAASSAQRSAPTSNQRTPAASTNAAANAAVDLAEDSDSDDDLPPLEARNANDSDSDDSDDVPDLLVRGRVDDSSSSSSEEEEEEPEPEDLPAVIERLRNSTANATNGTGSRGATNRTGSRGATNGRTGSRSAVDSDDSDGDAMPGLLPRASSPNNTGGGDEADEDSDDDMPPPFAGNTNRNGDDSDADSEDDIPELLSREMDRDSDDSDDDDNADMPGLTPPAAAAAAAALIRPRADRLKEAMENAKKMKIKELKNELRRLGITSNFVEKQDMIQAYVEAVVAQGGDESEEIVEEVDIFASMPGLVSAKDPPQNGTWILLPSDTATNKCELQYVFVDESSVKTQTFGNFEEGACLIPALDGAVWVYTPAENYSLATWEIHRVDPIFRMKLFDVEEQAQIVCDGHYGHWALNPVNKNNSRSESRLVFVANKFTHDGNMIRDHVPSGSSIFPDRSGGVWLHVPREGSSTTTTQPGLWHCTPRESTHVMSDFDDSAQIICDASRRGLMVLSPSEDGKSILIHVHQGDQGGDREDRLLDIDFTDVQGIVDDGKEGVYAHCRRSNRWKVCHATTSSRVIQDVYDCPKNSKICSDTMGGVWVWKKVGKAGGRCVAHVDGNGNAHERPERFPVGSVMGGT
jgi:hypothetical protein